MKLKYVGPFDEVQVPALGVVVAQGEEVEVSGEHADRLAEQTDNWTAVRPSRKKENN